MFLHGVMVSLSVVSVMSGMTVLPGVTVSPGMVSVMSGVAVLPGATVSPDVASVMSGAGLGTCFLDPGTLAEFLHRRAVGVLVLRFSDFDRAGPLAQSHVLRGFRFANPRSSHLLASRLAF